jgi:hypothetical protein
VAITTLTPGATIRYTTTGVEPTESDPVLGPGEKGHGKGHGQGHGKDHGKDHRQRMDGITG